MRWGALPMKKRRDSKSPPETEPQKAGREDSTVVATPEQLEKIAGKASPVVLAVESSSGPLPPPKVYREYDEIHPGAAERILAMAEKEQGSRNSRNSLGLAFGFATAVLCICASAYVALHGTSIGHTVVASLLAGNTAVILVGRFLRQRNGL